MNIYQPDITTPSTATTDASAKRVTVTSEAERRAHVAKWIARMQNTGAATLGTAMLFLPAVAGAAPPLLALGVGYLLHHRYR